MGKFDGLPVWPPARSDPWEFAKYAVAGNRQDLVTRYNSIVGRPSYAIAVIQNEFIQDRMDPREMMAFIKQLSSIIAAASVADPPRRPE